jgi:hypothetical protein
MKDNRFFANHNNWTTFFTERHKEIAEFWINKQTCSFLSFQFTEVTKQNLLIIELLKYLWSEMKVIV